MIVERSVHQLKVEAAVVGNRKICRIRGDADLHDRRASMLAVAYQPVWPQALRNNCDRVALISSYADSTKSMRPH